MNSEKTAEQGSRPGGTGLRLTLQILLPVLVVAIALVTARQIIANIEQPTTQAPPRNIPLVRTITAVPESLRLDVQSHGTVQPRTSVTLSPQVSGRVTHVAEALRAGGFFAAGETLFSIDDTDYRLATVQRQADLARARLRLAQEKAEQALAIRAWRDLEGDRKPDELATRALQVKGAEADLAAAQAAL